MARLGLRRPGLSGSGIGGPRFNEHPVVCSMHDGCDSAVLVCGAQGGKPLLEEAGCTAKLDQYRWNSGDVDRCDFTLDVKQVCSLQSE